MNTKMADTIDLASVHVDKPKTPPRSNYGTIRLRLSDIDKLKAVANAYGSKHHTTWIRLLIEKAYTKITTNQSLGDQVSSGLSK